MTARTPNPRDPGGFRAQFEGTCAICHAWFPKSTLIAKVRGQAAHVECYKETHE